MVRLNAVRLMVNRFPPVGVHKVARVCRESIRFLRDTGVVSIRGYDQSDMPADGYLVDDGECYAGQLLLADSIAERVRAPGKLYLLFTPRGLIPTAEDMRENGKYRAILGYGKNCVAVVDSDCLIGTEVIAGPVHEIVHAWLGVDHDEKSRCESNSCIMSNGEEPEEIFFCNPCRRQVLEADKTKIDVAT